jgi:hypothetical protein
MRIGGNHTDSITAVDTTMPTQGRASTKTPTDAPTARPHFAEPSRVRSAVHSTSAAPAAAVVWLKCVPPSRSQNGPRATSNAARRAVRTPLSSRSSAAASAAVATPTAIGPTSQGTPIMSPMASRPVCPGGYTDVQPEGVRSPF